MTDPEVLAGWVVDARQKSLELVADLDDDQVMGPHLDIINPLLWEIGHAAWFQEKWVLRHALGGDPIRGDADELWDSIAIPHDRRWDLPLPARDETVDYMRRVRDRVVRALRDGEPDDQLLYLVRYSVHHEDMHTEAYTYTRQTLGYPPPHLSRVPDPTPERGGPLEGDVEIPGGTFPLGARPGDGFVFDNEKWAHEVELEPFRIARAPVTQAEFARFVDDGGYRRRELWSDEGWAWREEAGADRPVHWRRGPDGAWRRRRFDAEVPLEPHRPMIHVNWHEARAWCRWAGRRLPTEAEWELAAAGEPTGGGGGAADRTRTYPWGEVPPDPGRVNMDWRRMGTVDVGALPESDSAFGCRQMLGNTWEWTADAFGPYPGFEPDMYEEYSQPWFHDHKVLRGGAWPTRSRMIRNTLRSYYTPDRRDVWAGFRTCAAEGEG